MTSFAPQNYQPKNYQQDALDAIAAYLRACGSGLSSSAAFAKTSAELYGQPLGYTPLSGYAREMPYFCLRVPTGGGKTWLAAKAVKLVNQHLLRQEHGVILWLTPSNAICAQTLAGLKDRSHPLRGALSEAGAVTVLDLDEAKSLSRATLDTSTVVIVATRQAFQVEDKNIRKVYENSGALEHHFDGLAPQAQKALLHEIDGQGNDTVPCSLLNVLRLRRPFIIVDEAHNNRTELAFDTLGNFLPSGVMELTATPDTSKTPSNVLYSVSAVALKNEEMIKLPIHLQTVTDWRQCLADAIDCLGRLQASADQDWRPGEKRRKPIALIQAEPRSATRETLHCEAIKQELVENQRIPEEEICIATGEEKGLEALLKQYQGGLNNPDCPVRYVITQKALAEGWDCPWAYVLASVADVSSATAVEQLLGRVLRQPEAKRQSQEALNRSYAFVVSRNFAETANALRDQLVSIAGFEEKLAREFVVPLAPEYLPLFKKTLEISVPENVEVLPLPPALEKKVHWNALARTLTIKEKLAEREVLALQKLVPHEGLQKEIARSVLAISPLPPREMTPSEKGETVLVPQLSLLAMLNGKESRVPFIDAEGQIPPEICLQPADSAPTDEELAILKEEKSESGQIDISASGKIFSDFTREVQHALALAYVPENWDLVGLAAWLCRQIDAPWLEHGLKLAFVQSWLSQKLDDDFSLAQAIRKKAVLRSLLEQKLASLHDKAVHDACQAFLFEGDGKKRLKVDEAYVFAFSATEYYPAFLYDPEKSQWGSHNFKNHYYPRIGDFDSREEFACAQFLDNEALKGNIRFWIRNLVKTPNSFSLTRIGGKFYPDFVCVLPDDRILVVEYKGQDRWDTEKVREDRRIGQLWAELSGGKCLFVMLKDKNWDAVSSIFNKM